MKKPVQSMIAWTFYLRIFLNSKVVWIWILSDVLE